MGKAGDIFRAVVLKKAVEWITMVVLILLAVVAFRANAATRLIGVAWGLVFWYALVILFTLAKELGLTNIAVEYTTYDIVVMGALIAVGGIFKTWWGQFRMIFESFAGPYAEVLIGPGFYIWGILACYLVRKPFSGTISMVIGGVIEIIAGNPFGLPVLLFNFWEGLGPDIAYGIFRLRKYTLPVAILAGLFASFLGVFYGWYYFGFAQLPVVAFIVYLGAHVVSGVLAGVIGHYLAVALDRIGVRPPAAAVIEEAA